MLNASVMFLLVLEESEGRPCKEFFGWEDVGVRDSSESKLKVTFFSVLEVCFGFSCKVAWSFSSFSNFLKNYLNLNYNQRKCQ
jgi:hypothetical protein